jgi:hypothetical protein
MLFPTMPQKSARDDAIADTSITVTMVRSVKNDLAVTTFLAAAFAIGCAPADDASSSRDAAPSEPDAAALRDRAADDRARHDGPSDDVGSSLVILPAQYTEENQPLRMLKEGDPIDLWPAPQGGHVVLVGAKLKHFAGEMAILRVRVRYPGTAFIIAEEARSVKFVPVPGEPDTKQPELATRTQVAHVPLCPDYDSEDMVDRPLEFSLQVTEPPADEPTVQTTLHLSPSCRASAEGESFCRCECSANYVLGKCPRDAGRD